MVVNCIVQHSTVQSDTVTPAQINARVARWHSPNAVSMFSMASGSLPHSLHVNGTSATNGGQTFAGLNLGTINYANSDNPSCKYIIVRMA
jgi:hypothetical protein